MRNTHERGQVRRLPAFALWRSVEAQTDHIYLPATGASRDGPIHVSTALPEFAFTNAAAA
jgi:hypothetical protein